MSIFYYTSFTYLLYYFLKVNSLEFLFFAKLIGLISFLTTFFPKNYFRSVIFWLLFLINYSLKESIYYFVIEKGMSLM